MKLYIKQQVFSWKDKFNVKDEQGNDIYYVEGEIAFTHKLHIFNMDNEEVAFVRQEFFALLHKYYVEIDGEEVAEIQRKLSLFTPKYEINGLGWSIEGELFEHDYTILDENGGVIAEISKEWFTWGDSYELDIADSVDPVIVLAVVIAIDAVLADQQTSAAASSINN